MLSRRHNGTARTPLRSRYKDVTAQNAANTVFFASIIFCKVQRKNIRWKDCCSDSNSGTTCFLKSLLRWRDVCFRKIPVPRTRVGLRCYRRRISSGLNTGEHGKCRARRKRTREMLITDRYAIFATRPRSLATPPFRSA